MVTELGKLGVLVSEADWQAHGRYSDYDGKTWSPLTASGDQVTRVSIKCKPPQGGPYKHLTFSYYYTMK